MTLLRRRMIEDMQVRNLSPKTIDSYVRQVAAFTRYFKRSPEALGLEEIRAYPVHLVHERGLSWSSFNQAVCAIRFLYNKTLSTDWNINEWVARRANKEERTDAGILFIDKKNGELTEAAKRIPRGQRIAVSGERQFSTTLSTHVLAIDSLELSPGVSDAGVERRRDLAHPRAPGAGVCGHVYVRAMWRRRGCSLELVGARSRRALPRGDPARLGDGLRPR